MQQLLLTIATILTATGFIGRNDELSQSVAILVGDQVLYKVPHFSPSPFPSPFLSPFPSLSLSLSLFLSLSLSLSFSLSLSISVSLSLSVSASVSPSVFLQTSALGLTNAVTWSCGLCGDDLLCRWLKSEVKRIAK